jgi:maltokinase
MTDESTTTHPPLPLDLDAVGDWLSQQRWYASKSRTISALEVEQAVEISADPSLTILLAQTRFATGAHDLYQLPLSLLDADAVGERPVVAQFTDGRLAVDAVADPELARPLLYAMDAGLSVDTGDGCMQFRHVEQTGPLPLNHAARPMGVEQSNSSIVVGEETVLKVFRRVEPGINPELEMLRFLTAREFPNVAALHGWYEFQGRAFGATLGVAQRFLGDATGGWELALAQIRQDPAAFIAQLGALGRVTAELHNTLASPSRPRSRAPRRWGCWWRRSKRTSSAYSRGCPTTSGSRRSRAAVRTCVSTSANAPSSASADGRSAPTATITSDRRCIGLHLQQGGTRGPESG